TLACGGGSGVQYLSIATGDTGGVYYAYGGGLAKVVSEHVPGVRATAESTAASVDNLKLIRDGKADVAFALADTAADAAKAQGPFAGAPPVPARALAVLYFNYLHLVTLDPAIKSLADLRNCVVATGLAGSGTEITARRVLMATGLDPDRDLTRRALGPTQGADALKDGKLDALFWSGGLPTPAFVDLAHSPNVRMRLVPTAAALEALRRAYGDLYTRLEIPFGTYRGVEAAVPVVGVANLLVVRSDMSDDLAYQLTRVMFERQADLAAIHPEAKKLSLATAVRGSPLEFHQGAIRYYRERSVWP
ncbi:MAG: TAXI family TRAP transporter solute-binding subunit, partial [Vicinamibacterales bacterium]